MQIKSEAGEPLWQAIPGAMDEANKRGAEVSLVFNGTEVRVHPGSHEYDIEEKWNLKRCIQQMKE